MNNENENQNIVLSFIVGAAAGLAAGILLAPETGEETRKTIAKKATDLKTDLKDKANTLKGQVGTQLNSTISKIKSSKVGAAIQNGKKGGKPASNQPNIDIVN